MDTKYYSQHGEEALINKYLDLQEDHIGSYIDIGAGYPEDISNTFYYYLKGWRGICVEPNITWNEEWQAKRPDDILLNVVIDNEDRDCVTMYDNGMEGSFVGKSRKELGEVPPFTAPGRTLMGILEKYPEYKAPDFFSLDVDSGEDRVLSTVDFTVFKPKLIIIEYQLRGIDFTKNWGHFLDPYYDMKEKFGGNAFYLRK